MRALSKEIKMRNGTFNAAKPVATGADFEPYERIPLPPDGWPLPAQMIWRKTCLWLKSIGHLRKSYLYTIQEYSWAVYRSQVAQEALIKKPNDKYWARECETNGKKVERMTVKLGFSPLDCAKIWPADQTAIEDDDLIR